MPSLLVISGTEAPAASSASAWRSLRTICSGVCLFFIENHPSTHLGRSDSHSNWISFRGAGQKRLKTVHRTTERCCALFEQFAEMLRDKEQTREEQAHRRLEEWAERAKRSGITEVTAFAVKLL